MAHLLTSGHLIAQRFAISEVAGSGGMGTVYKAIDLHTGVDAALKLLHTGNAGIAEAERFLREAKLLSELRHPGIVSYIAHGLTDDGRPFLAMEWLEGEDLGQRLRRELLTVSESLTVIRQVAEALSVAHQRGIVHRDLLPPLTIAVSVFRAVVKRRKSKVYATAARLLYFPRALAQAAWSA